MKKIQRLIMLLGMFSILSIGTTNAQSPSIVCPSDITIDSSEDYTDTDITGVAEAFLLNNTVEVEYTDIIINLDNNNEGFVRRRWNPVGRADIFCDQTIKMYVSQNPCNQNIVASLTNGSSGEGVALIYAESLIEENSNISGVEVSRGGVFYDDFIVFDCCDIGTNEYFIRYEDQNGVISICKGLITVEDKLTPVFTGTQPIYLGLFNNSVTLTVDHLSSHVFDNCGVVSATFSQSVFSAIGSYDVDYTISDASGNTNTGSLIVEVISGSVIVCNNNVSIALDPSGLATITPDMLLEGQIPANGEYRISINGGAFNKTGLMSCSAIGQENQITIQEETTGNQCWSNVIIEDKLAPILNIPDPLYLRLDVPTEAILTTAMLDKYTSDNCEIGSNNLSQNLFTSAGTYHVTYTVDDLSGNSTSQSFQVIVHANGSNALSCNAQSVVILNDNDEVMIDPFTQLVGTVYQNSHYTVGIGYAPDYEPTEYFETITLDCSHVGESISITVKDQSSENYCWGLVDVQDKKAPTPYARQNLSLTMIGAEPLVLNPNLVNIGSFDNCSEDLSLVVSPNIFYEPGIYTVKLRVYDESGNYDFAMTTIEVLQQNGIPIECLGSSTALVNPFGPVTLWASDFVMNNEDFDSFSMSLSPNGPYTENYDFNCGEFDLSEPIDVYVKGINDGVSSICNLELTLIDNIPPVITVEQNVTLQLVNGQATLTPEMVDDGSYDLCGELTYTLDQTLFTTSDIGENQVLMTVTDESGNYNQSSTIVTVIDGGSSIQCINLSTAALNNLGPTTLYAVDFLLNPNDFDLVTMSTSLNGSFSESIDFGCSDYEVNTPFDIFVRATNANEENTCIVSLTLIDDNPPVAIADISVELGLENCQAILIPEMVDDGSYDLCGSVSLSLSQIVFTASDLGDNTVILTVTDESGNTNQAITTVSVINTNNEECNDCDLTDIIFPSDITISDSDGQVDNLTVDNLQSFYNFPYAQVHPYTTSVCDNIAYAYEDVVINTDTGYKIIRTFTALDWLTGELINHNQLIILNTEPSNDLSCINSLSISLDNNTLQLFPADVLEGNNYDYSILALEITFNGMVIPNNIITPNYVGQSLTYTVTNTVTNNSCWGTIIVDNSQSGCPINVETDVSFPLDEIYLPNASITPDQYTPENLVTDFGFAQSDVDVILTLAPCAAAGYAFEDEVFIYNDGNYKITRTFTVIDWYAYNPSSTEGIYLHVQTINVGINPSDLICDILPNDAPEGNCDTGHTYDDDVEWPSDLSVADYRITPDGLIEYSNVEEKNARPIFFNNPDHYTASYIDLLVELTPSTLTIARVWKAVNTTYDLTWNYSQTIVVDFSNFENLVTVHTATDRAVPGVVINDSFTTNDEGQTQVLGDIVTIDFEDDMLNGVNIRDIILIQRHILGLEILDDRLMLAADANGDDQIKASDILDFSKRILGVTDELEWKFINSLDATGSILQPKATYTAYKKGDVDDSAILPGENDLVPTSKITVSDKVLNNGETYLIPVSLEDVDLAMGVEIRLGINTDLLEVKGIQNNLSFDNENYHMNNGELVILLHNYAGESDISQSEDQAVVYLECQAKANTLLSNCISMNNRISYAVDENINLRVLGGEIENIITGVNSPELATINVYPNPTSDFLVVDLNDVQAKGPVVISVMNTQGQIMNRQIGNTTIDVQSLAPGMYFYNIQIGEYKKTDKFLVIR